MISYNFELSTLYGALSLVYCRVILGSVYP
jgi:hypothetical protein